MKTNFLGPAYRSRSLPLSCQTVVNLIFEPGAPGSNADGMFFQRPGLAPWLTVGDGPHRGAAVAAGYLWVVSGAQLFRISSTGTPTTVGSVPGTGKVSLVANETQMVVMHSAGWKICTMATLAFAAVVDAPTTAQGCYIGGRIVAPNDNGTYQWSELNNAATIDALNFASAESRPDPIIACFSDHGELWLFGTRSTEFTQESGNADLPFTRTETSEYGCVARHSIAATDNGVFFVGQDDNGDPRVYRAQGYSPVGISDFAIDYQLKSYGDLSGAIGYCYQQEGHSFYVLTIPGQATWAFDIATSRWAQWAHRNTTTGALEEHRAAWHCRFGTRHLIGDRETGQIHQLDSAVYTDDGDPLYWERTFLQIDQENRNFSFLRLEVEAEMGVGLDGGTFGDIPSPGADPHMILSWSDDNGRAFPQSFPLRLGRLGEYRSRAVKQGLGTARRRVFKLSGAEPVKTCLYAVNIDAKVLSR